MNHQAQDEVADQIARKPKTPPTIVYLTVVSVVGTTVTVDFDGVDVPVPFDRCYGCGGTAPVATQTVACHLNGTQLNIIGTHL